MNRSQFINKQIGGLFLAGICVLGLVFFAPDAAHRHNGAFFKIARATSWHRPFELSAAWCSVKIILASVGLFLVIESLGSALARSKHQDLTLTVFSLQLLSVLVFLIGNYYLVKALF